MCGVSSMRRGTFPRVCGRSEVGQESKRCRGLERFRAETLHRQRIRRAGLFADLVFADPEMWTSVPHAAVRASDA